MGKKKRRKAGEGELVRTTMHRFSRVKHGLYLQLNGIDGRTRLGKTVIALRDVLREYVGESTPVTELLVQRICYKSLRLGLYEASQLVNLEEAEVDHYLPMANSLRHDLALLATMAGKPKAPNLNEYLKTHYGSGKKG